MLLVLVAIGGAVLWIYRVELLATTATRTLERNGFGPAHLVIDHVGVSELHARDITLYGGAVQVPELTLAYSPFQLLARHLSQVRIAGLRATLSMDDNNITLGGQPLPLSGTSSGGGVRIDSLKIDDARIALDRPGGRLEASFSTALALAGADLRNASFALDVIVPMNGAQQPVRIVVREFALTSRNGGAPRLTFANADIVPKALPWSAEGIAGELVWRGDGASAKIAVDSLKSRRQPPVIQPLRLTGEAALVGTHLNFTLHAETEAAGAKGKLTMEIKGRHDRASDSGSASVAMSPAVFRAHGLQPADFFPAIEDALSDVSGAAAVSGTVRWRGLDVAPNIRIRLTDISVDSQAARLSRVNGDINLVSLWPPRTPPNQVLKGVVEAGGLPPSDMTLQFHLLPAALAVEALTADFSGGRISTSPFVIDPAEPQLDTTLTVDQLDLDKLFALIDIDGLGGTGRLDGHMQLRLAGGRVRISDGTLAASGPGVLHFKSDALPKEISAAGQPVQLALEALTDFHYDSLTMEIDQEPNGAGVILLRLRGRNPAVLDGRPFQFNIKFESNFDRLTDLALRSLTAAQELLRRAVGTMR